MICFLSLFRYDIRIIKYTIVIFWRNLLISLLLYAFNEISLSNVLFIFSFYIQPFKVNSIFIIIKISFCSVNSISIS